MSRKKKQWIKKITSKDTKVLAAFANVGHLNTKMLNIDLGMSQRRIKNFERDNYIEKTTFYNKKTHNMEQAYRLTEKGRTLIKTEFDTQYFYKSNSPSHDLSLASIYLSYSDEIRNDWVTESQWRDSLNDTLKQLKNTDYESYMDLNSKLSKGELSPPDGGYISNGTYVAIEVITSSYGKTEIQAKLDFAKTLDIEIEIERG